MLHKGLERRRYYLFLILLNIPFRRPSERGFPWHDDLIAWSCAASIRMCRETQKGESLLKSAKYLRQTPSHIVFSFWKSFTLYRSKLFVLGDSRNEIRFYAYNGTTYSEMNELQMKKVVNDFLSHVFGEDIPRVIQSEGCRNELLNLMIQENPITKDKLKQYLPDGLPFRNCYASVEFGEKPTVLPLDYTPEMLCTSKLDVDYERAEFSDSRNENDGTHEVRLAVSDEFEEFLPKLVRNNAIFGLALKGVIRACITSNTEGHLFQTCLYLHGPPSCGKSEIVKMLESLIGEEYVQHMSRHHNQFSAGSIDGCKLLIIDDVQYLKRQDIDILKPLLGRDMIPYQVKFAKLAKKMRPTCQVILVSNHPPEHFALLREKGIVNKLITVELDSLSQLDEDSRIPDFYLTCLKHAKDLFNWAMYGREEDLKHQIRAELYHKQAKKEKATEGLGFHSFIYERLMYSKGNSNDFPFVPAIDMLTTVKRYTEQKQDAEMHGIIAGKNIKIAGEICKYIANLLKKTYDKDCPYTRYSRGDGAYGKAKPYGLKNLAIIPSSGRGNRGFQTLEPILIEDKIHISNLLLPSRDIILIREIESKRKEYRNC